MTLAGLHAVDGCRAETGFRHFGHDITCEDHVPEAGLGFTVKTGKGDFIGRDAVLRRREDGLDQRLVRFLPADPEPLACHDDPNLRDEQIVGHLASGAYGHHLGAAVGLGHVPCTRERAAITWVRRSVWAMCPAPASARRARLPATSRSGRRARRGDGLAHAAARPAGGRACRPERCRNPQTVRRVPRSKRSACRARLEGDGANRQRSTKRNGSISVMA